MNTKRAANQLKLKLKQRRFMVGSGQTVKINIEPGDFKKDKKVKYKKKVL